MLTEGIDQQAPTYHPSQKSADNRFAGAKHPLTKAPPLGELAAFALTERAIERPLSERTVSASSYLSPITKACRHAVRWRYARKLKLPLWGSWRVASERDAQTTTSIHHSSFITFLCFAKWPSFFPYFLYLGAIRKSCSLLTLHCFAKQSILLCIPFRRSIPSV